MLLFAVTIGAACFAFGYGIASKNVPDFLVQKAYEYNRSAWYVYNLNNTQYARLLIFMAEENCDLYRTQYRTENIFDWPRREQFVPFCNNITKERFKMFPTKTISINGTEIKLIQDAAVRYPIPR